MADHTILFDEEQEDEANFSEKDEFADDLYLSSDRIEKQAENSPKENNGVVISKSKAKLIKKLLDNIQENKDNILKLLSGVITDEDEARISIGQIGEVSYDANNGSATEEVEEGGRIVEGVFDGEHMIGPDGKQYSVPANYASKSKLIEGDILKLTITANGTFVYKQIGPIDRVRVVGQLEQNGGSFIVVSGNKRWKVLTASVTYYKGQDGDEAVILVPKAGESKWAAVENVVRRPA